MAIEPSNDPRATALAIAYEMASKAIMSSAAAESVPDQVKKRASLVGELAALILAPTTAAAMNAARSSARREDEYDGPGADGDDPTD